MANPENTAPATQVGREYGGMPSWDHRGGKVKGYNGMYRKYQGGGQTCQYQGYFLETLPILGTSCPAKTQQAVYLLLKRQNRPIPNHGKIG